MSKSCKLFVAFLSIVLMIGLCAYRMHSAVAQTGQPESKLEAANNAIEQAFRAVLDAEQAGANVTELLDRLSDASSLLARVEIDVRKGDLSAAANVDSVLSVAAEVETAAVAARDAALVVGQNALYSTVAFSSVGAVAFVLVLFLIWLRLKQSYVKRLFDAKPEVSVSET